MQDLGRAIGNGLAALGRIGLWLELLRLPFSLRGIAFVFVNVVAIVVVVILAFFLPFALTLGAAAVWALWAGPVLARATSPIVARHVIGPAFPQAVEQAPPPAAAYRSWLAGPLVFAYVVVVAVAYIPWLRQFHETSPLFAGAIGIALAAVATGFYVRSAVCTYVALPAIEASLARERASWVGAVAVFASIILGLQFLLEALRDKAVMSWQFALGVSMTAGLVLGIAELAVFAAFAAGRLLGVARETPRAARTRWPWVKAGLLLVVVLALSWPLFAKHYVGLILSFDPVFRNATQFRGWGDEETQRSARAALACSGNRFGVVLLHAAGVRQDPQMESALGCAAMKGDRAMVELLLSLGADVNHPVTHAQWRQVWFSAPATPLAQALAARKLDVARYLLDRGASPAAAAPSGLSPVHVSALVRCMECIEILHQYKADLNLPAPSLPVVVWIDRTPADDLPPSVFARLESLGAALDRQGADGRSALHAAAARGALPLVEWLLQKGLDPLLRDSRGMTPLMLTGLQYSPHMRTQQKEALLATALRLLEVTPDLRIVSTRPPGRTDDGSFGWTLGMFAARAPQFREAARRAGKSLDYGHAPAGQIPWYEINDEELRSIAEQMNDEEFASALWVQFSDGRRELGLPLSFAQRGWVSQMARALRLGLLTSPRVDEAALCRLLYAAAVGERDSSAEREESWRVLMMLAASGLDNPEICKNPELRRYLANSVARRTPRQQQQWNAKVVHLPRF